MMPEFTRIVSLDDIEIGEAVIDVTANARERAALAVRLGLLRLERLAVTVELKRDPDAIIGLSADLVADVVQSCVVTLESLARHVEERFQRRYARRPVLPGSEVTFDPLGEDPPEPLTEDVIDVGEAVAEQFGLALDPYPRIPGAVIRFGTVGETLESGEGSPFTVLRKLRRS